VLLGASVACFAIRGRGRPEERPVRAPAAEAAPA
jgi:hypothetical protein